MSRTRGLVLSGIQMIAASGVVLCIVAASGSADDDTRAIIEPRVQPRTTGAGGAGRIAPNIRVDADLVLIPVTVMDRQNEHVIGLERRHFRVFEDKTERPITQFASEDAPVSVVVLFDCSGSMVTKQREALEAVAEFLRLSNPDDEFALIEFADRPRLVVNFTKEPEDISDRLSPAVLKGQTALLDAICLALNTVKYGRHKRKALLIVSDGGDNHSRYTKNEIKDRVREADVQVYSLAILGNSGHWVSPEEFRGPALLSEIAGLSGGQSFQVERLYDLHEMGARVALCLRNQYILGFSPAVGARDGKYHRIDVKLAPPANSPSMRVTSRPGYYAPEP